MIAGHTPSAPPPVGTPPPGVPQGAVATPSGQVNLDLVDTVLADRYRVVKKLGEGGMGSVYLAEHTTINKRLAIKVLSPEFSHKQDLVDRFLQEARAASMIDQENVVEITDFGSTPNGSVFFVMEYLQGEDLSDTIKGNGPLPWSRVKPIMLQIVEALKCAHEAGIIHRDMKPENCFRIKRGSNEDFIKVLDFGIAKVTSDEGEGKNLTRTGMIFGTPEYMSPEQAKGEKVDHRVDVYALGVILYELLTGKVPFTADTFMGILTKHMFEPPAAPSTVVPHVNIPEDVEAIILKALQKDREYRFQDMADMGAAIEKVGTGSAAVSVVEEVVALPAGGQTSFKNRAAADSFVDDEPPKSKTGMVVGLGLAAAVLLGGIGYAVVSMGGDGGGEGTKDPANNVVAADSGKDSGTPEGKDSSDSAGKAPDGDSAGTPEDTAGSDAPPVVAASTVSITVSTPDVEGTVYDNRDDSILGKTNEPISMPLSSDSFDIYVRADGYEDFLTDVIPDKDKKVEVSLSKVSAAVPATSSKKRKKGRPASGKKKKKGTAATAAPEPTDKPPKDDKPPQTDGKKKKKGGKDYDTISGDLKNPFGK
jgi:serine/threonine-protein kinase